jgi:phosphotriesterase-related protein
VLGEVDAADLGPVDVHEHLFLRSPALVGDEFTDPAASTAEAVAVRASGMRTVVDLTPVGLGRRPRDLATLSREAGLHVVAATGYHRAAHYPAWHWAREVDETTLLEVLLTDLLSGMDDRDWSGPLPQPTDVRCGIVKLGASYQWVTAPERRWFTAGATAARRSGVPIAVHCEVGTAAHDVLDLLAAEGVPESRVLLAHMDRNPDAELHAELAARGAFLAYDTVGRIKYRPESALLDLLESMAALGHLPSICLGTDVGRRSMLRAYGGGPGMDVLGRELVPRLLRRLGEDAVRTVLVDAPARLLRLVDPVG